MITAPWIRLNERLQYSNTINYLQAYRTIQAVLIEMHSNKAKSFAKFLAFAEPFKATDLENFCHLAIHEGTSHFQIAFFVPAGLQHAQLKL